MSECAGSGCDHPEHGDNRVIVKYDERGLPIYDDDPRAGSRAIRRQIAKQARRANKRTDK